MNMRIYLIGSVLFLAACGSSHTSSPQTYLAGRHIPPPETTQLSHCHAYGCQKITNVALTPHEWNAIAVIFKHKPKNAAVERQRIAMAIGLFEQIVGPKDGTAHDEAGTFRNTGTDQLDCVDESTNTTTYLTLLEQEGLLSFHKVNGPTMRLPIIHAGHWPHQTAVITEIATNVPYAVDSWFQDNGADADIIDLKTWKSGWKPENIHDFL